LGIGDWGLGFWGLGVGVGGAAPHTPTKPTHTPQTTPQKKK